MKYHSSNTFLTSFASSTAVNRMFKIAESLSKKLQKYLLLEIKSSAEKQSFVSYLFVMDR